MLLGALPRYQLPELGDNNWAHWAERIESGEPVGWVPITPEGIRSIIREIRRAGSKSFAATKKPAGERRAWGGWNRGRLS